MQTIKSHPVVLYMKGTPQQPMCGFSAQVVRVLHQHGASFLSHPAPNHLPAPPFIQSEETAARVLATPSLADFTLTLFSFSLSLPGAARAPPPRILPPSLSHTPLSSSSVTRAGAEIHGVNVLENPAIRAAMKEFSSWPTFPQLYLHGEFVGGCDIVLQLHKNEELKAMIEAPAKKA
jgi:monothiol glutaredoxin